MKKTCCNCHWGQGAGNNKICFPGCFSSHDHYNWSPLTNGDMVRQMADEELAELWERKCDKGVFLSWLKQEVKDESTDN